MAAKRPAQPRQRPGRTQIFSCQLNELQFGIAIQYSQVYHSMEDNTVDNTAGQCQCHRSRSIRIDQLAILARENGLSMQTILDRAVEAYRRQTCPYKSHNADFAALSSSKPQEYAEDQEVRKL